MKTFLAHDLKIQQILILIFIATILLGIVIEKDFLFAVVIIEFFLIAIFQYSLNSIKFNDKKFLKTDSRKIYIFLSTYVVIGFLSWILMILFKVNTESVGIKNIFELMAVSWIFISPILIIQSLMISFFDFKNNSL